MVLARFERDFADDAGNLLTGNVSVEVRRMSGGLPQLYSDRTGSSALGNPFVNNGGAVAFHVAGNAYRVTVTQGAYSRELTYVAIGLAGESDFTLARNEGEWADDATYGQGDYVVHDGEGIFISTQAGNLNHEPDAATPGSTEYWTYLPGLVGPEGPAGAAGDTGATGAAGADGTTSYDWPFRFAGFPSANAVLDAFVAGREITFPADFAGSSGFIGTNPTSTLTLTVKSGGSWANDGTTVGTIAIGTGGAFTFATDGGTAKVIAAGTLLKVIGPGSLDATGKNVAATLIGDVP